MPQLCKQWELFTMVHHQGAPGGGTAPHAHGALTKMLHKCSARDVEHIESTTQRALKQPWLGKSDKLPQRDHLLHGCM